MKKLVLLLALLFIPVNVYSAVLPDFFVKQELSRENEVFSKESVLKILVAKKLKTEDNTQYQIVALGSGFVFHSKPSKTEGLNEVKIMTCAHVADYDEFRQDSVCVIYVDNKPYFFKLIQIDHKYDIAILAGEIPNHIKCVKIASSEVKDGDKLTMYGFGGDAPQVRVLNTEAHRLTNTYQIFADVNVICGDSGGPIFNANGELVGMIRAFCEQDLDHEQRQGSFCKGFNFYPYKKYVDIFSEKEN